MTSSWFFLSTLNYDARSTTHQIQEKIVRQVGYLQGSYQDARSTKHKKTHVTFITNNSRQNSFKKRDFIYYGNHTKHVTALRGKKNSRYFDVRARGEYSYHRA